MAKKRKNSAVGGAMGGKVPSSFATFVDTTGMTGHAGPATPIGDNFGGYTAIPAGSYGMDAQWLGNKTPNHFGGSGDPTTNFHQAYQNRHPSWHLPGAVSPIPDDWAPANHDRLQDVNGDARSDFYTMAGDEHQGATPGQRLPLLYDRQGHAYLTSEIGANGKLMSENLNDPAYRTYKYMLDNPGDYDFIAGMNAGRDPSQMPDPRKVSRSYWAGYYNILPSEVTWDVGASPFPHRAVHGPTQHHGGGGGHANPGGGGGQHRAPAPTYRANNNRTKKRKK